MTHPKKKRNNKSLKPPTPLKKRELKSESVCFFRLKPKQKEINNELRWFKSEVDDMISKEQEEL